MTRPPVDIISVIIAIYRRVWAERLYVVRLALFPFVLAWINVILVNVMGGDVSFLRRGLLMLPSAFAEGWLVAQFLRTVLTGERWPQRIPRDLPRPVPVELILRIRGLLGAIVFYVLTSLVISVAVGGLLTAYPDFISNDPSVDPQKPSPAFAIAFGMLVFSIFQFRLFFLHVPMVVNASFRDYFLATQPLITNIQMVAAWMAVQVPLLAVTFIVLQPLMQDGAGTDVFAFVAFLVASGVSVGVQFLLAILGSLAVAAMIFPARIITGNDAHGR